VEEEEEEEEEENIQHRTSACSQQPLRVNAHTDMRCRRKRRRSGFNIDRMHVLQKPLPRCARA
jgi:hypothetical protein